MKNFTLKTITGGLTHFFGGWLLYGMLFESFFDQQCSESCKSVCRPEGEMLMEYMALASLIYGGLVAYVSIAKNVMDWKNAAITGAILGALFSGASGFMSYSMMDLTSLTGVISDICVNAVLTAAMAIAASFVGKEA
jgi:hypothetical protein